MKKFLSVLLIVSLLILPIKTFAATDAPPDEISDAPLDVVSENEDMGTRAATDGIISGYIYNIKNVNSGKYLNVHSGVDADGTNIYQWTKDGSTEQNFKVIYCPSTDSYTFYAMCSSNGNFRVVNIHLQRGVEPLASGQNVNLWDPDAAYTQQFIIVPLGENQYRIACRNDIWLFLAANGTSNGSSGGTSPTSSGNVYLSEYVASMTQHWVFEPVGPAPEAEPRGHVESVDSTGITGWVWSNGLPDTSLDIHIYIEDGLGAQYFYVTTANIYRQDLYNCGYGNGYHGFFFPVNWSEFVPKVYNITIFAIGGTNPPIWVGIYDNRRPIKLTGLLIPVERYSMDPDPYLYDSKPYFNRTSVINSCYNIGCSDVDIYGTLTAGQTLSNVYFSSFAAICGHATQDTITCYKDGEYTFLDTSLLNTYPQNTFDDTKCLLLLCCDTGKGGATGDNLANKFHQRGGVQTVVSFQNELTTSGNPTTLEVYQDTAVAVWTDIFIARLGAGDTVQQATDNALLQVRTSFNNQDYGLASIYIAGNANNIIKH